MTSRRAGAQPDQAPSLFLEKATQPPNVTRMEMVCSAPYLQGNGNETRTYVAHPFFKINGQTAETPEGVCCWHDLHPFEGRPVHLPLEYHEVTETYAGLGFFCSPQCAKRYAIDHPSYNSPHQLTLLAQAYGFHEPVKPAPPQMSLKMLGGTLTIEEFRKMSQEGVHVVVQQPPFITCAMVFEERRRAMATGDSDNDYVSAPTLPAPKLQAEPIQIRGLRIPEEPTQSMVTEDAEIYQPAAPLYDQFLEQKRQGKQNPSTASGQPSTPAIRGSTMKGCGVKRQKIKATTEENQTLTSSASITVEVKKENSQDTKRGSLRAFMKSKAPKAETK